MNRTSPYYHLKYRVDFRANDPGAWETIAAFNSSAVAIEYAIACRNRAYGASPVGYLDPREWRVMSRKGRANWVVITKPEY
jgi:hypothetical protein